MSILFAKSAAAMVDLDHDLLARRNVEVTTCPDGNAVVNATERKSAQVVFIAETPESTARVVIQRLKSLVKPPRVVLLMPGQALEEAAQRSAEYGCDACLAGAIDTEQVLATAANLLGVARRESVRVLARIFAKVTNHDGVTNHQLFGTVVDISESGVRLETPQQMETGSEVDVEFFLPANAEPCRVTARIVREAAANVYGLRFTDCQGTTRQRIAEFVRRRMLRQAQRQQMQASST